MVELRTLRESENGVFTFAAPWDECTCSKAAENDHFEILKWALENGCSWNESTCSSAAENGHFEILKWAHEMVALGMKIVVLVQQEMVILKY